MLLKMLKDIIEDVSFTVYPFMEEVYETIMNSIKNKEYKTIRFYYAILITMLVYFIVMIYAICCIIIQFGAFCMGIVCGFIYAIICYLFNKD